ncbi:hypothetical protein PM082_015985 [Marasmius tenuissimus]|nr:hypothetical protein PM082_015985 [Marasmius tenuissimus]
MNKQTVRFPMGDSDSDSSGMWSWLPHFVGLSSLFATFLSSSSPFFSSAKLLILGSIVETGRRICRWLIERFRIQYSMTAQFDEGDPAYEWVVHFLTQQGLWRRSREFRVNAKSSKRKWAIHTRSEETVKDNAEYVPTYELPQIFRWNGYWLEIKRTKTGGLGMSSFNPYGMQTPGGTIFITIYSLRMNALYDFVESARRSYLDTSKPDVIIHTADTPHYNPGFTWTNVKRKMRRPLSSIILQEGVVQSLVKDAQEFLDTEDWYVNRGIPHRRGYLLHGPPGSGKSSTIYALAGELGLEIYSLSLASGFVDDSFLQRAVSSVPKRSIFLIEDIDSNLPGLANPYSPTIRRSSVTLSGLLNVIDGVGSDDGKLFFATTNYIDRLDPALLRPGRIDRKIQYSLATQDQAAALFLRFFAEPRTPASQPKLVHAPEHPLAKSSISVVVTAAEDPTESKVDDKAEALGRLADTFSTTIPSNEFSTAELQGYLLACKNQPEEAVVGITSWIEQERKDRRERKEREDARKRKAQEKQNTLLKGHYVYGGPVQPMQVTPPVPPPLEMPHPPPNASGFVSGGPPPSQDTLHEASNQDLSPSPAYEPRENEATLPVAESAAAAA